MSRLITSSFGREGKKGFKYTEIDEGLVDEDSLFEDLVDHWMRHYDWDEERDKIYPDEATLFEGERYDREIRLKKQEDRILIEYGIPTEYDHSQDYVDSVWYDEMFKVLNRNADEELEDHHIIERTLSNITDGRRKAV
jgi:hypothetical protein